jgi:hypothetical protein
LIFRSLVADLWSQVVSEDTELIDLEFSDQWLLLMEAETCEGGQVTGLVEKVQVVECELLLNARLNFNKRLILLSITIIRCKFDESVSCSTLN